MAQVKPMVQIYLDPSTPVQELCAVIDVTLAYHKGKESEVLQGVKEAIEKHIDTSKRKGEKKQDGK